MRGGPPRCRRGTGTSGYGVLNPYLSPWSTDEPPGDRAAAWEGSARVRADGQRAPSGGARSRQSPEAEGYIDVHETVRPVVGAFRARRWSWLQVALPVRESAWPGVRLGGRPVSGPSANPAADRASPRPSPRPSRRPSRRPNRRPSRRADPTLRRPPTRLLLRPPTRPLLPPLTRPLSHARPDPDPGERPPTSSPSRPASMAPRQAASWPPPAPSRPDSIPVLRHAFDPAAPSVGDRPSWPTSAPTRSVSRVELDRVRDGRGRPE